MFVFKLGTRLCTPTPTCTQTVISAPKPGGRPYRADLRRQIAPAVTADDRLGANHLGAVRTVPVSRVDLVLPVSLVGGFQDQRVDECHQEEHEPVGVPGAEGPSLAIGDQCWDHRQDRRSNENDDQNNGGIWAVSDRRAGDSARVGTEQGSHRLAFDGSDLSPFEHPLFLSVELGIAQNSSVPQLGQLRQFVCYRELWRLSRYVLTCQGFCRFGGAFGSVKLTHPLFLGFRDNPENVDAFVLFAAHESFEQTIGFLAHEQEGYPKTQKAAIP